MFITMLKADLIIFMPNSCKQVKFEGLERLQGVQVVQTGDDYIDAER
jgi:threonine dehydratase